MSLRRTSSRWSARRTAPTAPRSAAPGPAVLYNKKVYESLGLEVPTNWSEFVANVEKVKADGKVTPVQQTYGDTWTSQLFVLGDFANVSAQDPDWATEYTANKRKYADQPALQSFVNQEEMYKAGYFNKNFASATFDAGTEGDRHREAAHYPMLTSALSSILQNSPDNINDVGFFPLPAQDAADTRSRSGCRTPSTSPRPPRVPSWRRPRSSSLSPTPPRAARSRALSAPPAGPFAIKSCTLPDNVAALVKDIQPYADADKTALALEFLSPIKGPNLERITVEVGSGIRSAEDGAKLYDEDVKKQAQQLGLPGW